MKLTIKTIMCGIIFYPTTKQIVANRSSKVDELHWSTNHHFKAATNEQLGDGNSTHFFIFTPKIASHTCSSLTSESSCRGRPVFFLSGRWAIPILVRSHIFPAGVEVGNHPPVRWWVSTTGCPGSRKLGWYKRLDRISGRFITPKKYPDIYN